MSGGKKPSLVEQPSVQSGGDTGPTTRLSQIRGMHVAKRKPKEHDLEALKPAKIKPFQCIAFSANILHAMQ